MKSIVVSLSILMLLSSCEKDTGNPSVYPDNYKPKHTSTQLLKKLEAAYTKGNNPTMASIFEEWNVLVKPNSDNFKNQNDTLKVLYDIFKTVYQPYNLSKLGQWEWNSLNSKEKYVVVQNKLFYSVSDTIEQSSPWGSNKDSIVNFRPKVSIEASKVLYLTKEYRDAIYLFLGSNHFPLGTGSVMNPALPAGESAKRAAALQPYIFLLHGHWGNYWHVETHPEILNIQLSKSLIRAKAFYRVGYMGGEALLSKQGNEWVITESRSTWIE